MRQKELAALLRAIADWLDSANSVDIQNLVNGNSRFTLESAKNDSITEHTRPSSKFDLEGVRTKLEKAASIDEGFRILHEEGIDKRRKPLEELARSYQVAISKSDNLSDLAHRIISAVVGSRLHAEITQKIPLSK